MSFISKWKHAFALEPDVPVAVESLPAILEKFAQTVVARRLDTPAILFLEMVRPLNFLGSQMVFAAVPIAGLFANERELNEVARALEHRGAVGCLISRIEQLSGKR